MPNAGPRPDNRTQFQKEFDAFNASLEAAGKPPIDEMAYRKMKHDATTTPTDSRTSAMKELEAINQDRASRGPPSISLMEYNASKRSDVNVNVNNNEQPALPDLSKLPPGFTFKTHPDGRVMFDQNGAPMVMPIPAARLQPKQMKSYEDCQKELFENLAPTSSLRKRCKELTF